MLEYYPQYKKLFLKHLFEEIHPQSESESYDQALLKVLAEIENLKNLVVDVPTSFPLCLTCELKCPGYEKCKVPHIKWMWKHYRKQKDLKKNTKIFTPYTQRCSELYLQNSLEAPFDVQSAMSANVAPLLARALYLKRRLNVPMVEANPKVTLWRVGEALKVGKIHLKFYRHSVDGVSSRKYFFERLLEKNIAFIYAQDLQILGERIGVFEAFLCALTGYLKSHGQCEERPKTLPQNEQWIEIPRKRISW